ncbi:hypothetical protein AB833_03880 [Chromatiales bacterium (ex Bugula neritina AB1)]|nr:hypothetical protein AB833_03880 [Chromatiales bacterium (ex Bugula neritina AB1)]
MPLFLLLILLLLSGSCNVTAQPLRIGLWGASHATLTSQLLLEPFSAKTGLGAIGLVSPAGNELSVLQSNTDVVQMELHASIDACDRGEIRILPLHQLVSESGRALVQDYVPNTLQPCSIGQYMWSSLPVFKKQNDHSGAHPALISDFFNVVDFPGKRAMVKSPRNLAEWALASSGVAYDSIYEALGSENAWPLIRSRLADIEHDIVWVQDDAEALALVETGKVTFAIVHSHSALRKVAENQAKLGFLWDGAITNINVLAIPSSSTRFSDAWKYLQFATSTEIAGNVASGYGYGVTRYSAMTAFSPKYRSMLPTSEKNRQNIIWGNSTWWRDSGDKINRLFVDWLVKKSPQPPFLVVSEWHSAQRDPVMDSIHPELGTN